ncbi:hypothetical protein [Streptomyces sp. NPDC058665]|uniref:hypothetical protein n=1 Tax=Streptomyces sp. NPDC058665 TaxID=3346586 RepID=UPI00365E4705
MNGFGNGRWTKLNQLLGFAPLACTFLIRTVIQSHPSALFWRWPAGHLRINAPPTAATHCDDDVTGEKIPPVGGVDLEVGPPVVHGAANYAPPQGA